MPARCCGSRRLWPVLLTVRERESARDLTGLRAECASRSRSSVRDCDADGRRSGGERLLTTGMCDLLHGPVLFDL